VALETAVSIEEKKVVVLVGGVGGAKLAYGLANVVKPENLTVIVNVGDDFTYYGLRICPDLDTIMYTLAGRVDKTNGWGLSGDSTHMLEALRDYGEDAWFRLGDRDMATHLLRTKLLHEGYRLTEVTRHFTRHLGIACTVLPASDQPIATIVDTYEHGELEFQAYFVKHRWQPRVRTIRYNGIESAKISPEVEWAVHSADVILFGPSNPWLSIEPILAIPGMRELLMKRSVPRAAVTPIIEGRAIKGPAAKLMGELGFEVSASSVAHFYAGVINEFIIDERDGNLQSFDSRVHMFDTIMNNDEDKIRLARQVLAATEDWGK
jgi:LPPG:FO 2-phospho-L-lactate transferase